jgi:HSP20 family molecular chaperone IbpA
MPGRNDPTDRMWLRAVELLGEAERLHRRFFHFSGTERAVARWEPPADVFEDGREIVILVAMPGVPASGVRVVSEPGALVVRGERPLPLSGSYRVVQLEIPYGTFERRIVLPPGPFQLGEPELVDGCLVLRLIRLGEAPR